MESFFGRYKNPLVLMAVLFIQVIALATQVKRPSDPKRPNSPGTRLIRVWTVTAFTPIERAFVGTGRFFRDGWHNYIDLHGVRRQNQELQAEVTNLRMEEVRLKQDAEQAHRLQALLGFREKFISQTMAAQVIGTSGSEQSRVIYIDKGQHDGIKPDMAVITPDGIVGKVKDVFPLSSQVLMINDRDSGAGVILEKSRLQGVLRGTSTGELQIDGIMADQTVEPGEPALASGGDRIFPKGLPVGTVTSVAPDRDTGTFLIVKIKPATDLNRLEEVLVVTKMADVSTENAGETPVRAADILAQRLPTVPKNAQAGVAQPLASPKKKEDKKDDNKKAQNTAAGENLGPRQDRAAQPGSSQENQTGPQTAPAASSTKPPAKSNSGLSQNALQTGQQRGAKTQHSEEVTPNGMSPQSTNAKPPKPPATSGETKKDKSASEDKTVDSSDPKKPSAPPQPPPGSTENPPQ